MVKIIILTTILYSEPAIMPDNQVKIEASRKRGKGNKGNRRRGGGGLR